MKRLAPEASPTAAIAPQRRVRRFAKGPEFPPTTHLASQDRPEKPEKDQECGVPSRPTQDKDKRSSLMPDKCRTAYSFFCEEHAKRTRAATSEEGQRLTENVLKKLRKLDLYNTQITDAGCATLASALDSGAFPALRKLDLAGIPASAAVMATLGPGWGRAGLLVDVEGLTDTV